MAIRFDYSNVMAENIGAEHGLNHSHLEALIPTGIEILKGLRQKARSGALGFYQLPGDTAGLADLLNYAKVVQNRFDNYVHIGIGGSALGPIALHTSLQDSYYNLNHKPKMFFPDNIDPDWLADLVRQIDVSKTLFHVVSKSGSTAETAATMLYFMEFLKKKLGDRFFQNLLFTTDPVKGLLNQIAREYPIQCFRIPSGVGGRFSVLTPVGLLSAAVAGIDVEALLGGAREMAAICDNDDLMQNPAFLFAAIHTLYMQKGKNISVMMPYSNKLRDWADWYRQMWAESLGKKTDLKGNVIHAGQTPVKALGTTDQHSQVQLYVEGPNDKVISFLEVEQFAECGLLDNHFEYIDEFNYLKGKSLAELINAEKSATELALTNNQRPNLTFRFDRVNPANTGAFIFLLQAATAFAGGLLNINAFDQPGVEEGKIATYALMGRKGYESKAEEIKGQLQKKTYFQI